MSGRKHGEDVEQVQASPDEVVEDAPKERHHAVQEFIDMPWYGKALIAAVFLFLVAILTLPFIGWRAGWFASDPAPEPPPTISQLDEFYDALASGDIDSVVVDQDDHTLHGILANGREFSVPYLEHTEVSLIAEIRASRVSSFAADPPGVSWWSHPSSKILIVLAVLLLISILGIAFFGSHVEEFKARMKREHTDETERLEERVEYFKGEGSSAKFGESKLYVPPPGKALTYDDLGGVDEAIEDLKEVLLFINEPQRFIDAGAEAPKGVLLEGPPGCGKTALARATAHMAGIPMYSLAGSDFDEQLVGVGSSRVRSIFTVAKANAPSIIFIDEIDVIARKRGGNPNDYHEQTLAALLIEMDGMEEDTGVFVMGATNRPDIIDEAIMRPGRLTRRVFVPLPREPGRVAILKIHSRGKHFAEGVEPEMIAPFTQGYSGDHLRNMLNEAATKAGKDERRDITLEDLRYGFHMVTSGREFRSLRVTKEERKNISYHEAGHSVANLGLTQGEAVQVMTRVPRTKSLGHMIAADGDRPLSPTLSYWLSRIVMAHGGRVGEEIHINDVSIGVRGDLAYATGIAHAIVHDYGMDEGLSYRIYNRAEDDLSESERALLDAAVGTILDDCLKVARHVVHKNRTAFDALAEALVEKETLWREDIEEILEPLELKKFDVLELYERFRNERLAKEED